MINDTNIVFPQSLDLIDIYHDGDLVVIAGEHLGSGTIDQLNVWVFENANGVGTSWVQHLVYQGDESHNGTMAFDFDGDGDLDTPSSGWRNDKVVIYENLARKTKIGGWTRHVIDANLPSRTVFIDNADVNGNGLQDVLTGAWWYQNPGSPAGDPGQGTHLVPH